MNGHPARLGYLGRLRVDPAFRQRRLLDEGFAHCRRLHQGGDARIYLLSVVAGNAAARRMLERGHPGWPAVHAVDRFMTLAIPVRRVRSRRAPADLRIVSGQTVGAAALVECLRRSNRRHQFAPCWTMADLESPERTRGLELNDFVVGVRGGEIRGCLACWDQRAFKQVVVRGYSHRLAFWRPAVNLTSRWTGIPPLPAAGRRLEFAYLSHVAVDGDDPDVFEALVLEGCQRAITKDVEYVLMGLSARSPLLRRAELAFRHRAYGSMLYVAFWPDGERFVGGLDGRPSNPELAIL